MSFSLNCLALNCGVVSVVVESFEEVAYLLLLEVSPLLLIADHVALEGVWVTHLDVGRE